MTDKEIRERILENSDNEKVRIKRDGTIHVYGRMPNTNHWGWYFAGWRDELVRIYEFERRGD